MKCYPVYPTYRIRSSRTLYFPCKHQTKQQSPHHNSDKSISNMLPPVPPDTLQRNPGFEVLLRDLCSRKLNPDGSTRDTKKQRMHEEIRRVSSSYPRQESNMSPPPPFSRVADLSPESPTRLGYFRPHAYTSIPISHIANQATDPNNIPLNPLINSNPH